MDARVDICGHVWLEEGFRHVCGLSVNHKKRHECEVCQKRSAKLEAKSE